ncbi:hypothetical protein FDB41_11885 [Clostridium botulinum]|nr:hypothetical protein [Clostridium botulinum]NFO54230.1 hypothetical protein [Clostridium botulinum]
MEYISAEEFLKQHKKVQEVFLDWWKPSKGDLFENDLIGGFGAMTGNNELKNGLIPLLTEGQLRKFIEDKMNCKISINIGEYGYQFILYKFKETSLKDEEYYCEYYKEFKGFLGTDLLQAYWKVACEIAKEE